MDTSSFGRWMFHARENPASSKDWHCTKGDIFFFLLLFIKVPRTYELSALLEAHSFRHWVCQGTMWNDEEKACPCSPKKLVKDFYSLSFSYAIHTTTEPPSFFHLYYYIPLQSSLSFTLLVCRFDGIGKLLQYREQCSIGFYLYMYLFVRGCSFCSSLFVPGMFISLISSETTIVLQLHNNNAPKYRTCHDWIHWASWGVWE